MPIYEYWCRRCEGEFEQLRPMSQATQAATCPTCGGEAEKLPSVFASKAEYTIKVPRSAAFRQRGGNGTPPVEPPAGPPAST